MDTEFLFKPISPDDEEGRQKYIQLCKDINATGYSNCFYCIFCCYTNPRIILNDKNQSPYHVQSNHHVIKALYDECFPNFTQIDLYGRTVLHYPKDYKSLVLLIPLIKYNKLTNKLDEDGNSILHQPYDGDIARLFIDASFNPLILNNKGQSCVEFQTDNDTKRYLEEKIVQMNNEKYQEFVVAAEKHKHHKNYQIKLTLRNPRFNNNDSNNYNTMNNFRFNHLLDKQSFLSYYKLYRVKVILTEKNKEGKVRRITALTLP